MPFVRLSLLTEGPESFMFRFLPIWQRPHALGGMAMLGALLGALAVTGGIAVGYFNLGGSRTAISNGYDRAVTYISTQWNSRD